jgi:predicted nucleotide-binding protein
MRRPRVFLVHGHDHNARDELILILQNLGLVAVVLSHTADRGATIIEKFEREAETCEFALVLLTPDDRPSGELQEGELFKSRQNVIFEMGWFYARLGRQRTLLLHKGKVELPSDVTGVLYKQFHFTPRELEADIRRALVAGGVLKLSDR